MVLIAFVLIAAGVAAGVGVLLGGNTDPVALTVFDRALPETTAVAVFGAGAVSMLLVLTGVSIMSGAVRRSMERRRELRELEDEHEASMHRLEDENAQLRRELAETRSRPASAPGAPGGPPTGSAPPAIPAVPTGPTGAGPVPPAGPGLGGPPPGQVPSPPAPGRAVRSPRDEDPWADLRDDMDASAPPHHPPPFDRR